MNHSFTRSQHTHTRLHTHRHTTWQFGTWSQSVRGISMYYHAMKQNDSLKIIQGNAIYLQWNVRMVCYRNRSIFGMCRTLFLLFLFSSSSSSLSSSLCIDESFVHIPSWVWVRDKFFYNLQRNQRLHRFFSSFRHSRINLSFVHMQAVRQADRQTLIIAAHYSSSPIFIVILVFAERNAWRWRWRRWKSRMDGKGEGQRGVLHAVHGFIV